jgi:hypothetical protein
VDRPEEHAGDRRDDREAVDEGDGGAQPGEDGHQRQGGPAPSGDGQQDPFPPPPVAIHGSEGRDEGRREHSQQRDRADRGGSATLEGQDAESDREGPLGGPGPGEAELRAPQLPVRPAAAERSRPSPQALSQPAA